MRIKCPHSPPLPFSSILLFHKMKTAWAFFTHFGIAILTIFLCLFNSTENKKLQKSFEEIFGNGWHLIEMGQQEGVRKANLAQPMAQENEQQTSGEGGHYSIHPMINEDRSATRTKKSDDDQNEEEENDDDVNGGNEQQRKREIVCKFRAIKEKIKKQSEVTISNKQWAEIECEIAKELGTYRTNIYQWARELGMGKKKKLIVTDAQKREIVIKFKALKEQIGQQKVGNWSTKEKRPNIEELLAKKLGTYRRKIYKWIKELGMGQQRTNDERMAIMRQYLELKQNNPKMSDTKIGKALKISRESIRRWKGQFREEIKSQLVGDITGKELERMNQQRTNDGRMAIMRQYWETKRNDPKISNAKIGKALKISEKTISRWKVQFRELDQEIKSELIADTEERKRVIVREFQTIKQKIKQKGRRFSKEQRNKLENLLAKKLGASRTKIYEWIKELKIGHNSTQRRWAIIKKYWEMKRNDPKISERKIAEALKMSRRSIRRWKGQFGGGEEEAF